MNKENKENLIPVKGLSPFKRFCMTIGELPSSYLETMTYYEMLVWFTKYMQDTVIPTINNNASAVDELQDKYIEFTDNLLDRQTTFENNLTERQENYEEEVMTLFNNLQDFVNNYFNNLDVQEEINNKLDQMAEDGILERIIASYLNTQKIYDTFDEMVEDASNLVSGLKVQTLGYHTYNDKGGAFYKITDTPSSTDYQVQIGNLYATLILDNEMNVKQFGAYGDNTHEDTTFLQNALNHCKKLYITDGTYLTNGLTINNNQYVIGNNATLRIKDNIENNKIFNITTSNITIENLSFKGLLTTGDYTTQSPDFGIRVTGSNVKIFNCNFTNFGRDGIYCYNLNNLIVKNCYFSNCNTNGIAFTQEISHVKILDNIFINNPYQNINFEHNNPLLKVNDIMIKNNSIEWNDTAAQDKSLWAVNVACSDTVESEVTKYSNVIIDSNYLKNIYLSFQARLIKNLSITNNEIENCNRGVWIDSAGNDDLMQENILIENNNFNLSGTSSLGLSLTNIKDLIISKNKILNSLKNQCIFLSKCINNLIDGNTIINSEKRGISFTGYTQNTNVVNNYFKDTNGGCIYITSNQEDPLYLTIDNNTFIDTATNDTYLLRSSVSNRKNVTLTNFTKIVGTEVNLGLQIRTNEFDLTTCNIKTTDKYTTS